MQLDVRRQKDKGLISGFWGGIGDEWDTSPSQVKSQQ